MGPPHVGTLDQFNARNRYVSENEKGDTKPRKSLLTCDTNRHTSAAIRIQTETCMSPMSTVNARRHASLKTRHRNKSNLRRKVLDPNEGFQYRKESQTKNQDVTRLEDTTDVHWTAEKTDQSTKIRETKKVKLQNPSSLYSQNERVEAARKFEKAGSSG